VQKLSGDGVQPSPLILTAPAFPQPANPAALTRSWQKVLRKQCFAINPASLHNQGFTKQGNLRNRAWRDRLLQAGKTPNGVRWKNPLRRFRIRRLPENLFPGAGEGI
jgi:hypothetical protein